MCPDMGQATGTNRYGILCALGAYALWGFLPVYWKAVQRVPAVEILAHRIFWSFLFLAGLVRLRGTSSSLLPAVRQRKTMLVYLMAALLLSVNWGTYIWAVNADRIVETSLGYYINPLLSVGLGVFFLKERLGMLQWVAVVLATVSVGYLTLAQGALPWIALVLATSFALYGLLKKLAPLNALHGLTIETAMLAPLALVYLGVLEASGTGSFAHGETLTTVLLAMAGVVTATPLLLFAVAARQISLTSLGILQFFSPTCGLFLGVIVYREPFPRPKQIAFAIIWAALALYWFEVLRLRKPQFASRASS